MRIVNYSYIEMTKEEAETLSYKLIYNFIHSSKWEDKSVKRKFAEEFSRKEDRKKIRYIITKADRYYNKGVPNKGISICWNEYCLWRLFADFIHKIHY